MVINKIFSLRSRWMAFSHDLAWVVAAVWHRLKGMDQGTLIMSDIIPDRLIDAVAIVTAQFERGDVVDIVPDYKGGLVSVQVSRIIQSYTDYIRRTVWKEQ